MRKVKFTEPKTAEWINWKKTCEKKSTKLVDDYARTKKLKLTRYYNNMKKYYYDEDVRFFRKCAYCESKLKLNDDLDHYRPTKAVTTEKDVLIKQPGYYWLHYKWDNLLPSCKSCNSPLKIKGQKVGKHNRFPVKGKHKIAIGKERNESPLLINPTRDFPDAHLEWDNDSMLICARPHSRKGKMTVNVLGFHVRESLIEDWRRAYKDVHTEAARIFLTSKSINEAKARFAQLRGDIMEGKAEFSLVGKAALNDIRSIV